VDRTGSGSCPVAGCGISGIEPSGIKMDLMEVICWNGRWIALAHGRVQWQSLVLVSLNHRVLLSDSKMDLREIYCKVGGLDGTSSGS
jgi:hypothetical protein